MSEEYKKLLDQIIEYVQIMDDRDKEQNRNGKAEKTIGDSWLVFHLKKLKELPDNITVRQFEPDTFQQKVKSMLDSIVNLSTLNGNDLIALSPWQAPGIPVPPPKLDKEGNPIPEEHPKPKLETFGYELVVRGDYRSIIGFIASLNDHGELIEITDVKLENEAGENRSTTTSEALNPFKPIKLTTRLVLFLQPKL